MLQDNLEQFKGLGKTSQQFKILFLLRLTKEMIRNCETEDLDRLGSVIKNKVRDKKQKTKSYFKEKYPEHIPSMMYRHPQETRRYIEPPPPKFQEYAIQERTQYTPPQRNIQLNLGRLNQLIQDPNVVSIECPGPEENITIKGPQGTRTINLALTKDEINQILQVFSQVSRIPLEDGVTRIIIGRLNLSAVVSDVLGSRFIIKKSFGQQRF
jgi:hypothetical protein